MNKTEREWVDKVVAIGCITCRISRGVHSQPEVHHVRSGMGLGQRNSWFNILPLCPICHRLGKHGEALHAGKKAFEKRYGTELELLERVRKLI